MRKPGVENMGPPEVWTAKEKDLNVIIGARGPGPSQTRGPGPGVPSGKGFVLRLKSSFY